MSERPWSWIRTPAHDAVELTVSERVAWWDICQAETWVWNAE